MLETSSAKTAEAVTPFASPLLASIDRLVGQLASRIAGPQSQFSGRSLQFADRIFSRRLTTLGMSGVAPETLLAEREMEPQKWLLPNSWVPSAATLRGGPRGASAAAQAATAAAPAAMTAPAAPKAKLGVVGTPLAPLPAAAMPDAAAPVVAAAAGTELAVAPATATAGSASTAAGTDAANVAGELPTRAAAVPVAAARTGRESAMPQLTPQWSQELRAEPPPQAATAKSAAAKAAPVVAASPDAALDNRSESGAVRGPEPALPPAPSVVAASPPVAGETSSAVRAERQPNPTADSPSPQVRAAARFAGEAASTAGPPPLSAAAAPTLAAPKGSAGPAVAAAERPPAGLPAAGAAPAPAVLPAGETRVRDWLRPLQPQAVTPRAAMAGQVSAFARSLGHLGWSDERLGQQSPQRRLAADADASAFAEPESSLRAAAAPALPMVQARDLTPPAAVRPAKAAGRPVVAAAEQPAPAAREDLQPKLQGPDPATAINVAAGAIPGGTSVPAGTTASPAIAASAKLPVRTPESTALPAVGKTATAERSAGAARLESSAAAATEPGERGGGTERGAAAVRSAEGAVETGPGAAAVTTADAGTEHAVRREAASARTPETAAGEDRGRETAATQTITPTVALRQDRGSGLATAAQAPARRGAADPQAAAPATPLRIAAGTTGRIASSLMSTPALSPSLLASPALHEPRAAGAPANLIGLFAAGQLGRLGLPEGAGLSSAARLPYRTPGSLATSTERLATAIGTHAAAGTAGVENPFGGVQRWRSAPGLAGQVARALELDSDEPAGLLRRAQLSAARQLTFLPSPSQKAGKLQLGAGAATASPAAGAAVSREQPRASTAAVRPEVSQAEFQRMPLASEVPPAELRPIAENQTADADRGRPWRQAGGMATLAELFAAGVGLGSGAAVQVARKAGVGPAVSPMAPWLAKAAARTHFGLLGGPGPRRPPRPKAELDLVDVGEGQEAASGSESSAIPAAGSAAASLPGAAPAAYAAAPLAPASNGQPVPTAEPQPLWQQAGGLAATAEAFARGHGIESSERQAPGGPAAGSGGRWVPVTGGMMFINQESLRPSMMTPAATLARLSLPWAAAAGAALPETAAGSLGTESPRPSDGRRAATESSVSELSRMPFGTLAAGRGIDWGRAGGLGLRSELFAAGRSAAGWQARPLSTAGERSAWSLAPGVAAPLAHALGTSDPQSVPRWTMSESGLLFVSGPSYSTDGKARAAARRSDRWSAVAASAPRLPPASAAGPAADSSASLGERPWLHAGGAAILAELFSAGVGLGAGAAGGLAQQAGVAGRRSLLPDWLTQLLTAAESAGDSDEQARRAYGAALPFVAPAELKRLLAGRPSGARAAGAEPASVLSVREQTALRGAAAPSLLTPVADRAAAMSPAAAQLAQPATASPAAEPTLWPRSRGGLFSPAAMWQRAGGLGASAEAFARGRGIESMDAEAAASDDGSEAPAGRWLPVSGGMVFVPSERATTTRGQRAQAGARLGGQSVVPARREQPAAAGGRSSDWPSVGGLGLRSELFTSGLGQPPAGSAAASRDPLGGWAGAYQMLPSFQRQDAVEETPPRRFAWSGGGGLMYLAGASPSSGQRKAGRRSLEGGADATASSTAVVAPAAGGLVPGSVAALAERFGGGRGSDPLEREVELGSIGSSGLPLSSLFGRRGEAQAAAGAGSPSSGPVLPGRLSETMLAGFPHRAAAESDESAEATPRAALHSVERLTKLLSQLPAQWLPSAKVATAIQAGGITESPIWQRLSPNLTRLAATALRADGGTSEDGDEEVERHTHLTMVKGSSPSAAQKAPRPGEPAWKQQTPQTMVSAALQKVAGSGTPMAAAAKMLESMRGQSGSASRADDRISLGDLTLIAISMGDNRMAAISRSQSPSPVPHVESALRQDDTHLVQPETEHTMNQKVDALAKMCLKYVEKHEKMMKERGSFDS